MLSIRSAETPPPALEVHLPELGDEGFLAVDGADGRDLTEDRGRPVGIALHGIEAHLVQVGDLLLDRALLRLHLRHRSEEVIELLLSVFGDGVEGAVAGEFRAEGVLGLPAAGGIAVEINLRADRGIEVRQIKGGKGSLGLRAGGQCEERNHNQQ